ncbi:protein kinase [Streptomyces sp. ISL-43]|uniref:serine/threonine protein kinase n=1 Tax=Streptomyces sp. ISL-43 TaxID=2819183 RepID=UPI001BE74B50|nr:serine/threonine protein kinase [Streptomyces sp. ISL-43]MBT2445808.1 protein kinase [Streptomyces sp. ISL-43]
MSKPEHTESPEPSVGTGSPVPPAATPADPKPAAAKSRGARSGAGQAVADAAKPAADASPAAEPAEPAEAGPAAEDIRPGTSAEPRDAVPEPKPAAAKPRSRKTAAAKPAAGTPVAAKPAAVPAQLRKPVAAKAAVGAEPQDEKPQDAKPAAAKPEPAEPAAAKPSVEAKPAVVEPEDAKPVVAKPAVVEPQDAKPVAAKPELLKPAAAKAAGSEPQDAKVSAAQPEDVKSGGVKAEPREVGVAKAAVGEPQDVKPVAVSKADEVAAAVKAAAAKAQEGPEGRLLASRYRLGAVLGKGGMGTVWRAEDEILGRTVAVKELRFGTGVDEDEKRRLITRTLREAKAIARIRSGGAVTVYDVVDEDGRPWIVMELIEGPSLAEFVRENGTLTPRRAAEVGLAVLDVLRAAHRQGILHRDVKPSNVLLADNGNGRVVLTDFGIAQVEGDPSVTSTGMLVGAPSYISPERARGQRPGPPADMWSLGGLLYAAVEGVPPYDKGSALATLTAVMTEPVDPPKNAGPLAEVIYGLLVKDPAHRLDDAHARAMLTAVIDAPEPPAPVAVVPADETRQISLAEAQEAAEKAAAEKAAKAAEKAEKKERERREREQRERTRAALKSARKAAAAAAGAVAAATAAEPPASRPAPVVAPLTDVVPRRTIALAIAGVIVALAAIGSLIAYVVSGDDKGGAKEEGKGGGHSAAASNPATGSSPSPTPSPSPKPGEQAASGGAGSPSQGQSPSTGAGAGGTGTNPGQGQGATPGSPGGALPPGYSTVTDSGFHFSMAMPDGFKPTGTVGENSGVIYSRDGGFPRIQVDFNKSPGDDARAAWAELAPAVAGSSTNYKLLRLEVVDYRGYPTVADWEFERDQKGMRVRVLDRGFKMDAKHGYAIMISCAADQWDAAECTQMRNTAFQTFQSQG